MDTVHVAKAIPTLKATPLFAPLDEGMLTAGVAARGEYGVFRRGEVLFADNSYRPVIGLLTHGKAEVLKGRAVMSILSPGSVFGAVTLFAQKEYYATQITAANTCRVVFLPLALIQQWIAACPAFAESYIRYLSQRIYFLTDKIEHFTAGTAENRLAAHLLSIARADEAGTLTAQIETMSLLARKLDIGRASLYRAFDALTANGAIVREGKTVHITDEKALSALHAFT